MSSPCCDTRPQRFQRFDVEFAGPCNSAPFTAFETIGVVADFVLIRVMNQGLCPLTLQFTSDFCNESVQTRVIPQRALDQSDSVQIFTVSKLTKIVTSCNGGSEEIDACNFTLEIVVFSCKDCNDNKCGKKYKTCCNNRPINLSREDDLFNIDRRGPCDGTTYQVFEALSKPISLVPITISNNGICPITATFTTKGGQVETRTIEASEASKIGGSVKKFYEVQNVKSLQITCSQGSTDPNACVWVAQFGLFQCLNCDKKKKRHGKHRH